MISSQLALLRLSTKAPSLVVTACTLLKRFLFRHQGHISAALVLGGVDNQGSHVYHIYPHGSTSKLPYTTMGSGSLAAMAIFECGWKEDLEEDEAVELVKQAVLAGIFNDLGSGSNCDVTILRKGGSKTVIRGAVTPNDVAPLRAAIKRSAKLDIPLGATAVLSDEFKPNKEYAKKMADEAARGVAAMQVA